MVTRHIYLCKAQRLEVSTQSKKGWDVEEGRRSATLKCCHTLALIKLAAASVLSHISRRKSASHAGKHQTVAGILKSCKHLPSMTARSLSILGPKDTQIDFSASSPHRPPSGP